LILDELMRVPSRPADGEDAATVHLFPSAPPKLTVIAAESNGALESQRNLLTLSREAAARAELDAIRQALVRFHWNRRKAAAFLNVSYKTLLNKMKECGLGDAVPLQRAGDVGNVGGEEGIR